MNSLAWIEATDPDAKLRNANEAVAFAEKAAARCPDDGPTLDTLAAAYAESDRFKEAADTAQKAKQAAEKAKNQLLVNEIAARLKLYEAGKPYRDERSATKSLSENLIVAFCSAKAALLSRSERRQSGILRGTRIGSKSLPRTGRRAASSAAMTHQFTTVHGGSSSDSTAPYRFSDRLLADATAAGRRGVLS